MPRASQRHCESTSLPRDRLRIDLVVLRVGAHKEHERGLADEIDSHHQPVLVSADVEDGALVAKNARRGVGRFELGTVAPMRRSYLIEPSGQSGLRIGMAGAELRQGLAGNDVHEDRLCSQNLQAKLVPKSGTRIVFALNRTGMLSRPSPDGQRAFPSANSAAGA
jgi:hypothetical protein